MTSSLATPWVAPLAVARAVVRWPVDSQLNARRNALVASTHLTARAHERQQVEEFLDLHVRRWEARRVPRIGPPELAGPVEVRRLRAAL
jgi:hypothetical protein